jgi:AraC-like DNA-binding protein
MMVSRMATGVLAPYVRRIWACEERPGELVGGRELVLPTGLMHLAIRLGDCPLRVFESPDATRVTTVGCAVVGGARAGHYVRDASGPVRSVGAELLPGAARLLLGAPADVLSGVHTPLESCWSPGEVERFRDQLDAAGTAEARLAKFEALLVARLPRLRSLHPAVAEALSQLPNREVGALVRESGYSHRGFNNLFAAAVGLTPKLYSRVQRFAAALERVRGSDDASLAALALAAGYSDQAHFNRDFREFSGLSPGNYRALSPALAHHVPLR